MLLLQIALKCADLGHLAFSWDLHRLWVARLEEEFFQRGDREKSLGLPVSFLMDRSSPGVSSSQTGFHEFVVLPLFFLLHRALPSAAPLFQGATINYKMWMELMRLDQKLGVTDDADTARSTTDSSESCAPCTQIIAEDEQLL